MHKKHGFTLIELLTVVVILGVLTSIALPQYRKAIQRAQAADALINLKAVFDSTKRYYAFSSTWPTSFTGLDVKLLDVTDDGDMGDFRYTFTNNSENSCSENGACYVSACRLNGDEADSTYCLRAYYSKGNTRDVYTCQDNSGAGKYQAVCGSLCSPTAEAGECEIE